MKENINAKIGIVSAMLIFGTIGITVKYIPLPSSVIASARGLIGTVFILVFMIIKHKKPNFKALKPAMLLLVISGIFIGINWVLLFEAYNYTSVATATLCYYTQPVILILLSPIFLKEKLSVKKLMCVLAALAGMYYLSGVTENGIPDEKELTGILLSLGAALLYAGDIIINKKTPDVDPYDKTAIQLFTAGITVIPYIFLTEDVGSLKCDNRGLILLLILGAVHTGLAYTVYFGSLQKVKTGTVAVLCYIDPVVSVVLSVLFLKEDFNIYGLIGGVLILGAAFVSELPERKKNESNK